MTKGWFDEIPKVPDQSSKTRDEAPLKPNPNRLVVTFSPFFDQYNFRT